jgi:hypothetical protein
VDGSAHDLAIELLDEIGRLRAAGAQPSRKRPPELSPVERARRAGPSPVELLGGLPPAQDGVVDLMDALERSVAAAKEARRRHPQPGGTRLDDILTAGDVADLSEEFDR